MADKQNKKSGGSKKHGRNKRPVDPLTSSYVRGKISFEQYAKGTNLKFAGKQKH